MPQIVYPATVTAASETVAGSEGDAKFIAGGTALALLLKMKLIAVSTLVSLARLRDVPGWHSVELDAGTLRIGGGVTMAEIARQPMLLERVPVLAHAAAVVGNVRIRNVATMGGMMAEADYASDPPAALAALGASVDLASSRGRRSIRLTEFLSDFYTTELEEDEIVIGVSFAMPDVDSVGSYLKFCSRSAEDRPCVGVAAQARFEGDTVASIRVAVGAVSGTPQVFPEVLASHVGSVLDDDAITAVADGYAESVDPIDDLRGSPWYRREVVRAQVGRALRDVREKRLA